MAQFITDIFAQLDKKRVLLSAGTKEKHDTMTCLCRFCFL